MSDFDNINDVLNHRVDTMVFDIITDALLLEDHFLDKLQDPEPGLYTPGELHPLFCANKQYYRGKDITFEDGATKKMTAVSAKPITDLMTLKKDFDDIYDRSLSLVCSKKRLSSIAKFLTPKPTVPAVAMKLAIGAISKKLSQRTKNTVTAPGSYNLTTLIRPELLNQFDQDDELIAFPYLMDKVDRFIGNDTWNIYTVDVKGTLVIVTKGIDYRIFCYYENLFKQKEEEGLEG